MTKIFNIFLLFFVLISCSRSSSNGDEFASEFIGIYTEVAPVSGRTRIDFYEGNKISVMHDSNSNWGTPYAFKISGNTITLNSITEPTKTLYFKKISNTKFEIGDINFNDLDTSNMVFQK